MFHAFLQDITAFSILYTSRELAIKYLDNSDLLLLTKVTLSLQEGRGMFLFLPSRKT